jgi:PRC-barrel domain
MERNMSYKTIITAAFSIALTGVAHAQQPTTTTDVTGRSSVLATIPSNATTVTNYYKQNVYDPSDSKIGEIIDVLIGNDGKIDAFIVSVGGFLGIDTKDVVCESQPIRLISAIVCPLGALRRTLAAPTGARRTLGPSQIPHRYR